MKTLSFYSRSAILLAVLFWILPLGAQDRPSHPLKKIHLPIPSTSSSFAPFAVAKKRGFYSDEGFDVEIVRVAVRIIVPGMVAGSFPFSGSGGQGYIGNILQGTKMKYLMVVTDKPAFDFIVAPDIKSFKDLKGKVIGSGNTTGDQPDQAARAILSARGIDPDKDVKLLLSGGTTPDRNLLLRTGHVSGTLLTGEYSLKAQRDGYLKLAYSGDYLRSLGSAVLTLDENLRQNPDEAYRFVKATLKGLRFFRERKALSLPILDQFLGLKDLEAAERDYDFYVRSMTENGMINEETMRETIEQARVFFKIPKEREVKFGEVFDLSLVKKANEELKAKGWSP